MTLGLKLYIAYDVVYFVLVKVETNTLVQYIKMAEGIAEDLTLSPLLPIKS